MKSRRAILVLLVTAAPAAAQRPVTPEERAEAIERIHPVCRQYYRMAERCARATGLSQRKLDEELMALVMLSHGTRAAEACTRQIENNRETKSGGCDWSEAPKR